MSSFVDIGEILDAHFTKTKSKTTATPSKCHDELRRPAEPCSGKRSNKNAAEPAVEAVVENNTVKAVDNAEEYVFEEESLKIYVGAADTGYGFSTGPTPARVARARKFVRENIPVRVPRPLVSGEQAVRCTGTHLTQSAEPEFHFAHLAWRITAARALIFLPILSQFILYTWDTSWSVREIADTADKLESVYIAYMCNDTGKIHNMSNADMKFVTDQACCVLQRLVKEHEENCNS